MIALHFSLHDNSPFLWIEQGRRTTLDAAGKERVLREHGFGAARPFDESLTAILDAATETAEEFTAFWAQSENE